jgi:uncharacterized membrane protein YcaP (DUF421 family)
MLFDGWAPVVRVLVLGPLGYAALVFFLRVSGKRTLSKMNAFDFVVTVTLGSTFATLMLNQNVSLAAGAAAFAVLVVLQFIVTFLSVHVVAFRRLVKAEPTLLYLEGTFLRGAMRRVRVTEDEVMAAVRSAGHASLAQVRAVVLETDSSFSVIGAADPSSLDTLEGVAGYAGER